MLCMPTGLHVFDGGAVTGAGAGGAKLVVVVPVAVIAGMDALVVGQTEQPLERFPSGHQGVAEVAAHLGEDLPVRPRAGDWLFLQPSVEAFEYPRPDLPQLVHFIGPLPPAVRTISSRPAWWANVENARSDGTPVVLVTQGTVATDASELIEPTLRALQSEDLFVVAAGADASDLEHILTNAQVERFRPGGYGGVAIALANGVPVVSGGTTEEQAEVGQRVAYSGSTSRPTGRASGSYATPS